jgi:hypothetical protein
MRRHLSVWGAHGYAVRVSAFCRNELFVVLQITSEVQVHKEFVSVKNRNPHATSARSPTAFV